MKTIFSLFAILSIISFTSCSEVTENNDPVIGIWVNTEMDTNTSAKATTVKKEWIFNDAYLGRFHSYNNNNLEVISDFKWTKKDDMYIISYPGLENKANDMVVMKNSGSGTILKDMSGSTLATRE